MVDERKIENRTLEEIRIAEKIRELRIFRKLTLREVAERTRLSAALLSQIENNNVSPPIATLLKIANALDVKIGYFFEEDEDTPADYILVRKNERKQVKREGTLYGYSYELLTHRMKEKAMEPFLVEFSHYDYTKRDFFRHAGDEFMYVISGRIEYQAGEDTVTLNPGDSLYIKSNVPHRGKSISKNKAIALIVLSLIGS